MKSKPDTEQFKLKKDPSTFLEGGIADQAEKVKPVVEQTMALVSKSVSDPKQHREQKVFRLPLEIINALKRESYERSVKTGTRVTETELVEQALRTFFKI
jgi:hypothetical protein